MRQDKTGRNIWVEADLQCPLKIASTAITIKTKTFCDLIWGWFAMPAWYSLDCYSPKTDVNIWILWNYDFEADSSGDCNLASVHKQIHEADSSGDCKSASKLQIPKSENYKTIVTYKQQPKALLRMDFKSASTQLIEAILCQPRKAAYYKKMIMQKKN